MNANRQFLADVLGSGLELELVTAADLLEHITPEVLAHHLPVGLKAKLLAASLAAAEMTPKLVVDTIGVIALAEHSPAPLLWAALSGAMRRGLGDAAVAGKASAKVVTGKSAADPLADSTTDGLLSSAEGTPPDGMNRLKPNRSARPSARIRAGATSRRRADSSGVDAGGSDNPFDVDTRVGADRASPADFEILDESDFEDSSTAVRGDETTPVARNKP